MQFCEPFTSESGLEGEDPLIKVPILPTLNFIQESEIFGSIQLPQDPNSVVDGKTNVQSIEVEGIKAEDFK